MNRLGLGFFKLRVIISMVFSSFIWLEGSKVGAVFVWFIWIQFEYLLHMLNLEDKYISDWEGKLKKMIKKRGKKCGKNARD